MTHHNMLTIHISKQPNYNIFTSYWTHHMLVIPAVMLLRFHTPTTEKVQMTKYWKKIVTRSKSQSVL